MPLIGAYNPYVGVYNEIALTSGQAYVLGPDAGTYQIVLDKYHILQYRDPVTRFWRGTGANGTGGEVELVQSDGQNFRVFNQTGCPVGALLTAAGSGYLSAPIVTASAGISTWRGIVGGAVSATVVVTNGGFNYTYAPTCIIDAPQIGGIQATAYATLTSGAVSAVTIVDQGAGYASVPNITFVNDPRELELTSAGYSAAAYLSLTGSGTVTGLLCTGIGTGGLTTLPTLTFSGGGGGTGAAATALMNWTITAYAVTTAGAGLAGTVARITAEDAFPTTASAYTNSTTQKNLVYTRSADIKAPITGGGVTATGQVVYDGGIYTSVPTPLVIASASVVTTAPAVTFTMGGAPGVSLIMRVG